MSQLGLLVFVVINALYKQIILIKSIPFSLSLPQEPLTRDSMSDIEFNAIMEKGLTQAISISFMQMEEILVFIHRILKMNLFH